MGWYSHGPGNLDYKYGNVVAVAKESGLGRLFLVPRISAVFEEDADVELDNLEFLGPLQRRIKQLRLPWEPAIVFTGRDREAVLVQPGTDVKDLLQGYAQLVKAHVDSVLTAIEKTVDDPVPIIELVVSSNFYWELGKKDYGRLIKWLNEPLNQETKITEALLRKGKLDGETGSSLGGTFRWYNPPHELASAENVLDRDCRHFALHGLAQALLADQKLVLRQPDDDYQVTAWRRHPDEQEEHAAGHAQTNVLLFTPDQEAWLRRLTDALETPDPLKKSVHYLAGGDFSADEVLRRPEDPSEHHRAGYRFLDYVVAILDGLKVLSHVSPPDDGEYQLDYGWHAGATLQELAAASSAQGFKLLSMSQLVDRLTIDRSSKDPRALEAFLTKHGLADGLHYVLEGSRSDDLKVIPFVVGALLLALASVDLDDEQVARFRALILASEREK